MKRSVLMPLVFIAIFVLAVGLACEFSIGNNAETQEPNVIIITATPESAVESVVTEAPVVATEAPVAATDEPVAATEPPATEEPAAQADKFFIDEFDNGMNGYSHFLFNWQDEFRIYEANSGLEEKAGVSVENGRVNFNMEEFYLGYYFVYEPETYEDVKVSMEIVNLGYNASSAALFCRYDENMGWYQLTVDFQGLWALWYYDALIGKNFNYLTNGGAAEFDYGKGTNTFTLVCEGDTLSVYVNDVFAQSFTDDNLKSGKVGFGARTDNTYTIINIPWFEVSQP